MFQSNEIVRNMNRQILGCDSDFMNPDTEVIFSEDSPQLCLTD